ncbi:unnamed protein product [Adineta steineri]|uniref:Uncharacterized protein n=1 Tax=Adineta steineri TaxID=433720 RepID=A0A818Q6Q1_9BILA|nr:unnamed protein product [Adineta steineri]
MRFSENITDNTSLFIDECKSTNHQSSTQYRPSRKDHITYSTDKKSSSPSEYIYTEIVKAIGNNEFIKEKSYLKRVSWSPMGQHECGLPPTGKRTDTVYSPLNKNSNRIRMRPPPSPSSSASIIKTSQPQHISLTRPVSFNEKYDRIFLDRISNQSSNRNGSLSKLQRETSPTRSLSPLDTILPIPKRISPPIIDNSDFISDTSSVSSLTTSNTTTSLPSAIYSRRKIFNYDRIYSTSTRPLLREYQQRNFDYIDSKSLSSILKTDNITLTSSISSSQSPTTSSSSSPLSFTCFKGHEESSLSSSSLIGSSLNQHAKFTTQTSTIDSSREDIGHPTTTTTIPTRSMMTMSISPNRHHNQTYSMNPINTSIRPMMTNNNDGLKQQRDQIESTTISNSCLKSHKTNNNNNNNTNNRTKKSVHFDWHLPTEYRPPLPTTRSNYQLPATVTCSSMRNHISNGDNEEQKKKNHDKNLTYSETEKQMPFNSLLMKTPNSQTQTTTKKFIGTGGFFNFINRSNSNNNKPSSPDDTKYLRRTASTQRKPKQHIVQDNKRLSADIESYHTSSISLNNVWKGDIDKAIINGQRERQSTIDNNINSKTSYNTDPSISSYPNTNMNRTSISMLMKPSITTTKSNEEDSLTNGLLFQPAQPTKKDGYFLSSKSLSNTNESASSSSSIGKIMQTSTLIISTPPQYHYYLYPPLSSSVSKKTTNTNRTISNVSMNSISTNSSSSPSSASSSYESQIHDLDDETFSCSAYQNKIYQTGPYSQTKPVILSDSVQAFWPPPQQQPPSTRLNNDPEQIKMVSPIEQNKHSNLIKHKQSESNTIKNNTISSTYNNDDSLSITNGNQTDVLPPPTSLILNNKEEVGSYSEQSLYDNTSLRIGTDISFEDTPALYTERLREKSRSIAKTNRSVAMNLNNYSLSRSRSKDTLNNENENSKSINRSFLRPKSAGQTRVQALLSPLALDTSNDFQSKRQFFENRIYTDNSSGSTNNKVYTLPPTNTNQRHITK